MTDMTQGSPLKVIIRFMLPVLAGNILQLTYSLADTRIIGGFLGDNALASVGAATVLYNLFIGFFMGAASGFSIMLSHKFGAGRRDELKTVFAASLVLGVMLELVLISLTMIFITPVMSFLNVPDSLIAISLEYISIALGGMIITIIYDVLLASARAIGDSLTPLMILLLSVLLNIAGDLLLIGVFDFGVKGAAIATVLAQTVSMVVSAVYLMKRYEFFRISAEDFRKITPDMVKFLLASGCSMGLMSSLINIGSFILQTAINGLGSSYIVAQTAARRLTEVFMSLMIATGQTMATYCGQNYGAGRWDRIKQGLKSAYMVTFIWCGFVILVVNVFSPLLVRLITGSSDALMISSAVLYLRIDTILYVLVAVIMIQRNSLQGMGDRITPLVSSGIEMLGKVILTCTLVRAMGYMGVILVEPIVWIVMIIPLIVKMRRLLAGFGEEAAVPERK